MALYFAVLACGNLSGWKLEFKTANAMLQAMCALSKTDLFRARHGLIEKGLIEYENGRKHSAGTYRIVPLYGTKPVPEKTPPTKQNETNTTVPAVKKTNKPYKNRFINFKQRDWDYEAIRRDEQMNLVADLIARGKLDPADFPANRSP